ncbi:citrate lyase subunit beta/citryl-CoA lyase/(S)-citramalyl-CoA lyase [Litorimonas taeanensis]|uniref:Citrate lyase subunit beta/citryl-CoA lyase/(S)-citramalyl-CoA lyase n=1 Tax=Litorimonas taeanensis TaxID=568099 RepID=A0A420WFD7_9PROT|nr:CoA ester lyase [Litorimonas taeanensis]RKQ69686.1 citrate lyase subunit beta/citryl-CoA lyase/(S)-citramalyl-CoA lyase [Litorimonas taeanensis]
MALRSQLFVPGNRPDRFEKACQTEADLICIDLEDAVGPGDKESARAETLAWLAATPHKHVALRINPVDTDFGQADIKALADSGLSLPFVMIPKLGSAEDVAVLDSALPKALGVFFAIIESAKGVVNCGEIFRHPRVKMAIYGAIDYAGDVGCDRSWETHLFARSKLVAHAAVNDVILFDTPHTDIKNLEDCEATTRKAKALGIFARSAIHPMQIGAIHNALRPSEEELSYANRVMDAFEAADGNVVVLDGKMIEEPIVKSARRILAFKG